MILGTKRQTRTEKQSDTDETTKKHQKKLLVLPKNYYDLDETIPLIFFQVDIFDRVRFY